MSTAMEVVVVALLISACASINGSPQIEVSIEGLGNLLGSTTYSLWSKRSIYQFQGIPYAKPPSYENRFKEPVRADPWTGVLNATSFKRRCPQAYTEEDLITINKTQGYEDLEDCLYLNVYTTQVPGKCTKQLPVMFYIHGGSFKIGSAHSFRPNHLLEQDVVLVVIQYRLGIFGFLSLQDDNISGNMGLLDMVMALKWVNKHIEGFCGDSNLITVFGQSAGAAAVSLFLVSPLTKGLFHRAIIQSGSALCPWPMDYHPVEHARTIAYFLHCDGSNQQIYDCLKVKSVYEITEAHSDFMSKIMTEEKQATKRTNGGNHAVLQVAGKTRFLTENPQTLYASGKMYKMPVMVGVTKHEGSFLLGNIYDSLLGRNPSNYSMHFNGTFTQAAIHFSGIDDTTGAIVDVFENKYFTEDQIGNFTSMVPGLIDICGVTLLKGCALKQARQSYEFDDTYLYTFNYLGHITKFGYGVEVNYPFPGGVAHSDELVYLFPDNRGDLTEKEKIMAKTMVELWTNFAIYGKPTPATGIASWSPMTTRYGPYLRIDKHSVERQNFIDEYTIAVQEGIYDYGSTSDTSSVHIFKTGSSLLITIVLIYFHCSKK